jgi:carbon monoxide dehydrogenase subunit G
LDRSSKQNLTGSKISLDIKGEYRISCDRQRVWEALNDPAVLQKCIPGCESLEMEGESHMRARIVAAIGPVKSKFDTRISLENLDPPQSYTLSGESKAGAAGFGRGSADVRLQETDTGTLLSYDAKFQVGGKLAQVGSRLVLGATRKMADDFFGNFSRALDSAATRTGTEDAASRGKGSVDRKTWTAVALAVLVLLIYWLLLR